MSKTATSEKEKTTPVTAAEMDPYYAGEKLYSIGGGRYIQFDGNAPLPEGMTTFIERTGRKPPFMLLPETPVDFYLSKGFGGSSKVHWPGEGPLPAAVVNYLNDHGTLPRTRENLEDMDDELDESDLG